MLAGGFQRKRQRKQCLGAKPLHRAYIGHLRFSLGDGAGFIQHHSAHPAGGFQRGGGFKQNALFGAQAAGHHNGHGRGQPQRARAADHQHADGPGQHKPGAAPGSGPCNGRKHRQPQHTGHKHGGHPVSRFGNGGLAARRILHHANDLLNGGILPHPAGLAGQESVLVHCACAHRAARLLIHGNAFAGQRRFIHRAGALGHLAVHRNAFAGAHHKHIPHLHLLHRHLDFLPVLHQRGCFGGKIHQAANSAGGFALAVGFQRFAHCDQRKDRGGAFKIVFIHIRHGGRCAARRHGAAGRKQRPCAVAERRACPHGHQRVHVGRAVNQTGHAAYKEFLVDHHDRCREQQLVNAHAHMIARQKSRQRPVPQHMAHAHIHQRHQQHHAGRQTAHQARGFLILQGIGGLRLVGAARRFGRCAIARLFHRLADGRRRGRGVVFHLHAVGKQAHRHAAYALHAVYGFFHMAAAGGAGHAGNGKSFHKSSFCVLLLFPGEALAPTPGGGGIHSFIICFCGQNARAFAAPNTAFSRAGFLKTPCIPAFSAFLPLKKVQKYIIIGIYCLNLSKRSVES